MRRRLLTFFTVLQLVGLSGLNEGLLAQSTPEENAEATDSDETVAVGEGEQGVDITPGEGGEAGVDVGGLGRVDVEADHMEFTDDNKTLKLSGRVRISDGVNSIQADEIEYNTETEWAVARGNVILVQNGATTELEEVRYNVATGQADIPSKGRTQFGALSIGAARTQKLNDIHIRLEDVSITTCADTEKPDFEITASRADVYEETVVRARHSVFKLHGVPFFYVPSFTMDTQRERTNFDIIPGYNSRDGVFLLTTYTKPWNPGLDHETQFDIRTERGVGIGQNFHLRDLESGRRKTSLYLYYHYDANPYKNEREEEDLLGRGIEVDENRYRIKFNHSDELFGNDALRARTTYMSDARVENDFFEDDFRESPVPESYINYAYLGGQYTINLEVARQLNDDFFGGVARLPEVSFNVPRTQLGESRFLFESEARLGQLERYFNENDLSNGSEDYDSLRGHVEARVFYPRKYLGWLVVTPSVGLAYTHYSDTVTTEERVEATSTTDANGVISTSLSTNTVEVAAGADARVFPEFGLETSFKAFSIIHENATNIGAGLRHVVEPFANYTFIPEPDLDPDQILQFDSIDDLDEENELAFGVRNKWQTKRITGKNRDRVNIHDYANVNLRTSYDFREDVNDPWGDLRLDTRFRFWDSLYMEFDFRWDLGESELKRIDTEIEFVHPESEHSLKLTDTLRVDDRHTTIAEYSLFPLAPVGLEGFTRYEWEKGELEEQSVMLKFRGECVGYGFGVKWIDGDELSDGSKGEDDWRIWAQIWLIAFPEKTLFNTGGY